MSETEPTKEELAQILFEMVINFLKELLGPYYEVNKNTVQGEDDLISIKRLVNFDQAGNAIPTDRGITKTLFSPWAMVDDERADHIFANIRFCTNNPEVDALDETFFVFSRMRNQYICNAEVRSKHLKMIEDYMGVVDPVGFAPGTMPRLAPK